MAEEKKKRLYTDTDRELHRAVRVAATQRDQTMQEWLADAAREKLAREAK